MPNADGSFSIKVCVCHNSATSFITTPFQIRSIKEWDGRKVCNRRDAGYINERLEEYLHLCEDAIRKIDYSKMAMPQIRKSIMEQVEKDIKSVDAGKERKSNRMIYAENREKYYNELIPMFESGMIAKEIVKVVPIGKSTVYRWYDEYVAANKDANARKSPKKAAETIKQLKSRIKQLEAIVSADDDCVVVDKGYLTSLRCDMAEISTDIAIITERLTILAQKLSDKL